MADNNPRPNFLEAATRKTRRVEVGRGFVDVMQLSFIGFLKFDRLRDAIKKAADPASFLESVWSILELCVGDVSQIELAQVENVLTVAIDLNFSNSSLPWQKIEKANIREKQQAMTMEEDVEYDGRFAALLVALLSSQFGWSANEIMNELTYDAVICFAQEALLTEHAKQEFLYSIAGDIGLRKVGDGYVKEPFPKPAWMRMKGVINPAAAPKSNDSRFSPTGVIHDYTNWDKTGKVDVYVVAEDGSTSKVINEGSA